MSEPDWKDVASKLLEHAEHRPGCASFNPWRTLACTCGLGSLAVQIQAAQKRIANWPEDVRIAMGLAPIERPAPKV